MIFLRILLLCFILSSCSLKNEGVPQATSSIFIITPEEEIILIKKANDGDNEASLKLYRFYDFVKSNRVLSIKWLTKSAEDGNSVAQYSLGVFFSYDPDLLDLDKAKYWLEKASENGDSDATKKLMEMRRSPVSK